MSRILLEGAGQLDCSLSAGPDGGKTKQKFIRKWKTRVFGAPWLSDHTFNSAETCWRSEGKWHKSAQGPQERTAVSLQNNVDSLEEVNHRPPHITYAGIVLLWVCVFSTVSPRGAVSHRDRTALTNAVRTDVCGVDIRAVHHFPLVRHLQNWVLENTTSTDRHSEQQVAPTVLSSKLPAALIRPLFVQWWMEWVEIGAAQWFPAEKGK